MNAILILLGETKLSATIEILFLLIVAAAIGYITAWLYYKSIYTDRIKIIESEKNKLSKDLLSVESENGKLHKTLLAKDIEINSLKLVEKEANRKLELVMSNNDKTIQLIQDRDESLALIAQRKKFLDYQSFGTATEEEKDEIGRAHV